MDRYYGVRLTVCYEPTNVVYQLVTQNQLEFGLTFYLSVPNALRDVM